MSSLASAPSTPTIGGLITSDLRVDGNDPISRVLELWESHPGDDGMAVIDGERVRFLSRSRFFLQLGRRFGYSLFEKRPALLLAEDGSTVEADMDPVEVISIATQREPARIYDDLLVVSGGRFQGLVSMRSLIIHHKDLLVQGIADRATLEERNRLLREVGQAQGEFMASLTEDLRRPVDTLLAAVQALSAEVDPSAQASHLELLRARAQEAVSVLDDLQDLAGLARGDL
jgi:signal transduction histidine kinase